MARPRITVKDITGIDPKKVAFVVEYVKDFSARRAAEASGYPADSGWDLLKDADISRGVDHVLQQRLDASHIDAEWLLMEAVDNHQIARQQGKLSASNTALNMVAKHVMVDAFAAEKVEISTDKDIVDRLLRARSRMKQQSTPNAAEVAGCGACHQHGCDPKFENGKCTVCERTPAQIESAHGFVNLKSDDTPVSFM